MRIIRDEGNGTLIFVPDSQEDEEIIFRLQSILQPGKKMNYCGRKMEGDELVGLEFESNGFKFILSGTSQKDKSEVGRIRNMCFYADTGLIYIMDTKFEDKKGIVVTGTYCKLCANSIVDMLSCEHQVCDACAERCKHKYKEGFVHNSSAGNVGKGKYCKKCGRGKPEGVTSTIASAYC